MGITSSLEALLENNMYIHPLKLLEYNAFSKDFLRR